MNGPPTELFLDGIERRVEPILFGVGLRRIRTEKVPLRTYLERVGDFKGILVSRIEEF